MWAQYHKLRTYGRFVIDLTIILGQILEYFVNLAPGYMNCTTVLSLIVT